MARATPQAAAWHTDNRPCKENVQNGMTMQAVRDEVTLVPVDRPQGADWSAFTALYREAFPAWEREPLPRVTQRIAAGRYRLTVLRLAGEESAAGFHLLDYVAALDYAMLTFLALHPAFRGRGLGQRLLRDAISRFLAWPSGPALLFVEAEAKLVQFYQRVGFCRLAMDYRVPCYGDVATTQSMALLAVPRTERVSEVDGEQIRRIIEHVFVDGYHVRLNDPRLAQQLQWIPDVVRML